MPCIKYKLSILILLIMIIPTLSGYVSRVDRKTRTAEAIYYLNQMAKGARDYYINLLESQPNNLPYFPQSIGPSPWGAACQGGVPHAFNPSDWSNEWSIGSWSDLNFYIDRPFYYRYSFESQGVGSAAIFTARAEGDLNCDGINSIYEITGRIDENGQVHISPIWTDIYNEFK